MCTAVASNQETAEGLTAAYMKSVGLVDAHAYSLISAKEIKLGLGKTERICLVRNPWGKREWTGAWSDESDLWNDYTRSQVPDYKFADDGLFWISFADYEKFFYITTICFYKTGYLENSISDELETGDFGLCKLVLTQDAEQTIAITIDQINARFVDDTMRGDYLYAPIRFIVTRIGEVVNEKDGSVTL